MKTAPSAALFIRVESFFTEYLQRMRGASIHTVRAYRDALKLFFEFVAANKRCSVSGIDLGDMTAETVARFLLHLETDRSNSVATRNCRRTAIRSFFKHLLRTDIIHSHQYAAALALPAKKARHRPATYLEADEVRAILARPDTKTIGGWRDYTLLLFLYNTGSRVSEAAGLCWNDLQLTTPRQVRLHGKGRKDRLLPLWRETAEALRRLGTINHPDTQSHVFLNRNGEALSRDGIAYILRRHVQTAARDLPALAHKRVTPHVMRHSCAVGLLQSGNGVEVIRDYLFYDLHVASRSQIAEDALRYIGQLYDVEREARDLSSENRLELRQRCARPIAEALHAWMVLQRARVNEGSSIAKALDYSLRRWAALTRYLDDPQLPIDNNWCENQIRPIAVSRGNWLFAGSARAGRRQAAVTEVFKLSPRRMRFKLLLAPGYGVVKRR